MRVARWILVTSCSVLGTAAALCAAGCQADASNCHNTLTCIEDPVPPSGGPKDPDCQSTPQELSGAPLAKCGIFADPKSAGPGDGSIGTPFKSLQSAIDAAATADKPVYACGAEFSESLVVPSGVKIYGGLDCNTTWAWKEGQPTVVKPSAQSGAPGSSDVGMRLVDGKGQTVLQDIDLVAPDATVAGVSSIALLIADTRAELIRCQFTAGNGADGAPGVHLDDDLELDGVTGGQGFSICAGASVNPGAPEAVKTCGGATSTGGKGGDGGPPAGPIVTGGNGDMGTPEDANLPAAGVGGAGQAAMSCAPGTQGADGALGTSGAGATGDAELGLGGYKGRDGLPGGDGKPGQGGGGGGGAKGKLALMCTGAAVLDRAGASGGSGGTGGCGGARGGGGQAGGASIALLSLSTHKITLTEVTLRVGNPGNGGVGGEGQSGGNRGAGAGGGQGFGGTSSACAGGDGGQGGNGGPGGGGRGGDAFGLAFRGAAPEGMPGIAFKAMPPTVGKGGLPGMGSSDVTLGTGADGISAEKVKLGP